MENYAMYELITQDTLQEYEAFVQSHPKGNFAQSHLWGKQKPAWIWKAIAVRGEDGKILTTKEKFTSLRKKHKFFRIPIIRGCVNFFDAQVVGVKALMHSADLAPEEFAAEEEPSKLDLWLEKKLGDKKFQQVVVGAAVAMGLALSVVLFFLLPMVISSFFADIHKNNELNNFVLPVVVSEEFLAELFTTINDNPNTEVKVDLPNQMVTNLSTGRSEHFDINGYKKHCLINGLDDIDFLVANKEKIEAFEHGKA